MSNNTKKKLAGDLKIWKRSRVNAVGNKVTKSSLLDELLELCELGLKLSKDGRSKGLVNSRKAEKYFRIHCPKFVELYLMNTHRICRQVKMTYKTLVLRRTWKLILLAWKLLNKIYEGDLIDEMKYKLRSAR